MARSSYRYPLYRMRHKAHFGSVENRENLMGVNVPTFVDEMTLHYVKVNLTIMQRYGATGSTLEHSTIIAIRHNPKVKETMLVKLEDGNTYRITNVSANDDDYISYDLLTLERYTKGE
ncbi:phage head closure protein [Limosilactobacillus pontis]|uniref:phage head closure protein n=1 Tax=Limosilactobacillus pontis TaxID=35787 RepID=UPI002F26731E